MVQVDYLVLADAAAVAEGKHFILGAGWDAIYAVTFPVTHPSMSVALRLRVPWGDTNQPHVIELDVVDADERSILRDPPGKPRGPITMGRPANAIPGEDQVMPLVFQLAGLQFPQPGTYAVVLRIEGAEAGRAKFGVRALRR